MIVVIPSAREVNLAYLANLIEAGARFIVVDDSEGRIKIDHPQFSVYNWQHRRHMLGDLDFAFPKRNGACRDFGFYVAWSQSDSDEIIIALDDDCDVPGPDFAGGVEQALARSPRPVARPNGVHLNILNFYKDVSDHVYPRGFPYSERATAKPCQFDGASMVTPVFNLGLWKGVFDVNGIDKISGPAWLHPDAQLKSPSVVIPEGALISVCSMNMHFRRAVTPAVYQLPMHIEVMPGWVIDRYGDIWGGMILKALMDRCGDVMTVGEPMISHQKAGGYERNIWQEHLAHLVNDEFIDLMLGSVSDLAVGSYLDMMDGLAQEFSARADRCSEILRRYLEVLAPSMRGWVTALRKAG